MVQNNNNNSKRVQAKDNKQFTFKQNLSSAFSNVSKLANNNLTNSHHQNNLYGNNNWSVPPPPTSNANNNNNNNVWTNNTSYSEVVAQPVEPKTQQSFGMMNGFANGHRHHQDHEFTRTTSFGRMNDFNFDQEMNNSTQYGPIGTRKSPSSTPSWEPLNGGMNQHIAKPSPYGSSYFSAQPGYGVHQQSKLMNLMSYNDPNAQQQQQQQATLDERYQYFLQMKERQQQIEWLNSVPGNSTGSLWSSSSNWATPSPPPGFEQQFQQQQQLAQNNQQSMASSHHQHQQQQQSLPAYDPFKSLSAIWNPSGRNNENERGNDSWNQ